MYYTMNKNTKATITHKIETLASAQKRIADNPDDPDSVAATA